MEMYYEDLKREVKNGKFKKEDLEVAYSAFKKILDAAEEEMTALRRMYSNINSEAIESLLRKKRQEYDAIEEVVSVIRRELY